MEDLLEQLPGPMRVAVGQRRARRRLHGQVRQLALAALQAAFDLARRMRATDLAKHHGH
ncbi:MAG: hypothetical protein KIT17_01925 [Rubrivivax sp.]|nr:hypothetical protein [Rubrivivax sp.]